MADSTKTLCPYCGVGCGLEVSPPAQPGKPIARAQDGTPIWQVRGDRTNPSSQGMVCVKGATVAESLHKDRLRYPMVRDSLSDPFRRATWDEAIELIVDRIRTVQFAQGSDAICMYGSGQFQTEDYYIAQKLMKGCLGTNNFDANSRLCMSSAVAGYLKSFGADGPPCCYEDLEETDCAFFVGANAAECHPIVFNRFRKYHKKNPHVKLVVVDPRRTETAEAADLHLAIKPGTDIDLFNGIAFLLLRWGKLDRAFVESYTNGFEDFQEVVRHYPPDVVSVRCGIAEGDLLKAAHYWSESQRVLTLWSMGVNQSSEGTAKVCSIINVHLMTGQIGKPGAGPFSLTGQPNAMGGREAGGLAHLLPGYRVIINSEHRAEVERFWQLPKGSIAPYPGRTAWEMILGLESGEVGLLWVAATNPAVSMPDLERTKAALRRSPFTVYQDCYYPTEMADYAHVVLPTTQWSEKTGTMTNSERRVTLCPQFRPAPAEARTDWMIFAEVGRRLGFRKQFAFNYSAEVFAEYAQITRNRPCDQSGLTHTKLRELGPTQWPYTAVIEDAKRKLQQAKRLYTDFQFWTPDRRARFNGSYSRGLAEPPDDQFPFVLTTGRLYGHWHTMSRTGRIDKIRTMHPTPFIEVHPRDAEKLGVKNEEIVEVRSRRGSSRFPVKVTKAISPGTVFVPMHWGSLWADAAEANALTHPVSCPDSKQPELKACAVQIVPIVQSNDAAIDQPIQTRIPDQAALLATVL